MSVADEVRRDLAALEERYNYTVKDKSAPSLIDGCDWFLLARVACHALAGCIKHEERLELLERGEGEVVEKARWQGYAEGLEKALRAAIDSLDSKAGGADVTKRRQEVGDCPQCNGIGKIAFVPPVEGFPAGPTPCQACAGTGKVSNPDGGEPEEAAEKPCPGCSTEAGWYHVTCGDSPSYWACKHCGYREKAAEQSPTLPETPVGVAVGPVPEKAEKCCHSCRAHSGVDGWRCIKCGELVRGWDDSDEKPPTQPRRCVTRDEESAAVREALHRKGYTHPWGEPLVQPRRCDTCRFEKEMVVPGGCHPCHAWQPKPADGEGG